LFVVPAFYTLLAQDRRKKAETASPTSDHGVAAHQA
jgi:hypothetical protein